MTRRGLSLLEMLIALTLTGLVALLSWSILQSAAFRLRDRSERMSMEHSLQAASTASRALLEPLGHDSLGGADLSVAAPDGFVSRAVRASGVLCGVATDSLWVRNGPGWWIALRDPVGGRDSVIVGTIAGPDRWAVASLDADPVGGLCPDGAPALRFAVRLAPADLAAIGAGSPLRIFEPMELQAYSSSGVQWVGLRSVTGGGAIQPLAGPFLGIGLQFSYYSITGVSTSLPRAVARADLSVTGLTEHAGGVGIARVSQARSDSMRSTVLLRNAP